MFLKFHAVAAGCLCSFTSFPTTAQVECGSCHHRQRLGLGQTSTRIDANKAPPSDRTWRLDLHEKPRYVQANISSFVCGGEVTAHRWWCLVSLCLQWPSGCRRTNHVSCWATCMQKVTQCITWAVCKQRSSPRSCFTVPAGPSSSFSSRRPAEPSGGKCQRELPGSSCSERNATGDTNELGSLVTKDRGIGAGSRAARSHERALASAARRTHFAFVALPVSLCLSSSAPSFSPAGAEPWLGLVSTEANRS